MQNVHEKYGDKLQKCVNATKNVKKGVEKKR